MTDAIWRRLCIKAYGQWCRSCGYHGPRVQVDHLIPRSQGGRNDVENGLILCDPFVRGCHQAVTENRQKRQTEWLTAEQLAYLDWKGWLVRHPCGQLTGRGIGYFDD